MTGRMMLGAALLLCGCDTSRDRVEAKDAAAQTGAVMTNQADEPAPKQTPPPR